MQIADFPHKAFWPHFMLLTFFLTAILTVFMVVISLLFPETGPGPSLPTLAQTYASQPPYDRRKIWFGWSAIGMLMAVLYYLFG
jgi:SSS family solute:Na+ symporter